MDAMHLTINLNNFPHTNQALKQYVPNLNKFPKILNKNSHRIYDLVHRISQIDTLKENPSRVIVDKLPFSLQKKWVSTASSYKSRENMPFPTFAEFVRFVSTHPDIRNDTVLVHVAREQHIPTQNIE
ncbi:hypothetical protein MAR_013029 [Mya arenaria]|uniref:Uncharacterized protein n=1 Tax=Mya arenaria TaxID=6604 RepID=A0ABY7FYP0_MYAAR|nr:hypothetical protein MAR_013029 [Mya arenaria]